MKYEYKMLPFPATLRSPGQIALHLQGMAEEGATKGWEFYRVDTISVQIPNGCLAAMLGNSHHTEQTPVATFRREVVTNE